jgi:hypothetical protein
MSTDFNINLEQAKAAGVEINESWGDTGQVVLFPTYPYWRDALITKDEICLSCNGRFRGWLKEWLTKNNIDFEMYPED